MIKTSNDVVVGAGPRLRCLMKVLALHSMTQLRKNPLPAARDAGYSGIQFIQRLDRALINEALTMELAVCGRGRAKARSEAELILRRLNSIIGGLSTHVTRWVWASNSIDPRSRKGIDADFQFLAP